MSQYVSSDPPTTEEILTLTQPSSNLWYLNKGTDTIESSSYKTLDVLVTHPVRATQLALDYFLRQKLGHGVVVNISSIAAQMPLLPITLYAMAKHAISGFTRSLAHLEETLNIRVVAVAPGAVKTPFWYEEERNWIDESVDTWVSVEKVVDVMMELTTKKEQVGSTILEVGVDVVRPVNELDDPGPSGRGHSVAKIAEAYAEVYNQIGRNFGK
jgi:NAD(P)-dependent dehydrogenase (short-subunit alcohol dehydrogenase family)